MAKNIVSNTNSFEHIGFFPSFIILAETYRNITCFYWLLLSNLSHLVKLITFNVLGQERAHKFKQGTLVKNTFLSDFESFTTFAKKTQKTVNAWCIKKEIAPSIKTIFNACNIALIDTSSVVKANLIATKNSNYLTQHFQKIKEFSSIKARTLGGVPSFLRGGCALGQQLSNYLSHIVLLKLIASKNNSKIFCQNIKQCIREFLGNEILKLNTLYQFQQYCLTIVHLFNDDYTFFRVKPEFDKHAILKILLSKMHKRCILVNKLKGQRFNNEIISQIKLSKKYGLIWLIVIKEDIKGTKLNNPERERNLNCDSRSGSEGKA